MTGIERLRRLAGSQDMGNAWTAMLANELTDIADQIERETQPKGDPAADVSVSAYDLLPQEDREAIAWVRDHGGLEQTSLDFAEGMAFGDIVDDIAARLGVSVSGLDSQDARDRIMPLLDRRLMPEGMEWLVEAWPRFEDDAPVRFEDEWCLRTGGTTKVGQVVLATGGSFAINASWYEPGERVKRPEPKVLDADGEEIRVGDTVYLLPGDWCDEYPCLGYHGGEELEVFSLHADHVEGGVGCRDTRRPKGTCYPQPSQLTHRAPVIAADGRPLREGEHVWDEHGDELVVVGLSGGFVRCRYSGEPSIDSIDNDMWEPSQLTHERPDTWERIEEDAGCTATKYNERRGTIFTTKQQVARDLVRRCRALAERERGE